MQFLSDEIIIKIFKKNKNPRAFLKNCEEVCRIALVKVQKRLQIGILLNFLLTSLFF